jgi:hypothetical protein
MTEDTSKAITYDVWMGNYPVIDVSGNAITMNLGSNVHITLHCATPTMVKVGDKLPLFTRIPLDANARLSHIFSGS